MSLAYRFRRANELYFCGLRQIRQDEFRAQIMRSAPFRATIRTHMAFLAEVLASGGELRTLFNSPGMLPQYFSVDEMHGLGLGPLLDAIWGPSACRDLKQKGGTTTARLDWMQ